MQTKHLAIIKVFAGLAIAAGFLYLHAVIIDPDLGWHLKVGEQILRELAVPRADIYSHTMPRYPWVDHEWFVNAWFAWMSSHGLWWMVIIVFTLLSFLPFLVWLSRASSLPGVLLSMLVAILMTPFLGVRPQIISFALFFILFEILSARVLRRAERKNILYFTALVPILFFVWANLHAGFFSGIVLFGLFIAADYFAKWRATKQVEYSRFITDLFVFFMGIVATLANPYGWKLYKLIFEALFSHETSVYILEWRPAFFFPSPALAVFLGIFLFLVLKFLRKYPLELLVVASLFFASFVRSVRMEPLFLMTAVPIFTEGIGHSEEEVANVVHREQPHPRVRKNLMTLGISVYIFMIGFFAYTLAGYEKSRFPEEAIRFLNERAKRNPELVLLNPYEWGGYILWRAPETKVFIDGRMPHWVAGNGDSAMKEYAKIFYSGDEEAWREVFKKRKITTVLLKNPAPQEKGWTAKYMPGSVKNFVRSVSVFNRLGGALLKTGITDLKAALIGNDWEVSHEDEMAIILECSQEFCSR